MGFYLETYYDEEEKKFNIVYKGNVLFGPGSIL